ncbi:iron-sulfur cluster assembly scaffold protein [Entomobacter blattae]|uniref:Iron-sulfur cluster assembly scaffold protein IscU n=1 Tax=Entomobacter blattae TaxID=2762277 RepID=A0A7H1NSV6_9PROT|nr:iron-sulfur cluster assembly scaffold protein [Entomobacter blattae]QNT78866.1 Iron-sulfur cluster assembly scaffold protein IscU [Entomobacter blattae]
MAHEDLYQSLLIKRANHPLFKQELPQVNKMGQAKNPLCGDFVQINLFCSEEKIEKIQHITEGCLICKVAADIMAEKVVGLSLPEIQKEFTHFQNIIISGTSPAEGDLYSGFAPLYHYKARINCATLSWFALLSALGVQNTPEKPGGRSYGSK